MNQKYQIINETLKLIEQLNTAPNVFDRKKNKEGYVDLTSFSALSKISQEQEILENKNFIIQILFAICKAWGFWLEGGIHLKHPATGMEFLPPNKEMR